MPTRGPQALDSVSQLHYRDNGRRIGQHASKQHLGKPGAEKLPSDGFLGVPRHLRGHGQQQPHQASTSLPIVSAGVFALTDHAVPLSAPSSSAKASDTIVVAPGVPALKRSLVELILAGIFVDLGEFPPAKGFGKSPSALSSDLEGEIVLLQAADYVQSKKHIPDLATWTQCFAIYSAVLVTKYPERAQTLFVYSAIIARLSKQFRWPSFIIYDQYFRQEAADTGKTDWSKIDSSIHAQCFTGMSLSAEGWCSICTSMDHVKATCPYRPADDQLGQKRPLVKPKPPTKRAHLQLR